MNNKLIIVGLVVFVLVATFPFWINLGASAPVPEPELSPRAKAAKVCVEPAEKLCFG